jgi:LysR family transcriptional regulator, hydrogen peroxide-inducible genes activator
MNLSGLSLRDLEYVVAVADHGSFVKAAEQCRVAQPSLSVQVSKLEARLETVIFERSTRRLLVTPDGLKLLDQMRRVLVEARALLTLASHSDRPFGGTLRLSAIATLGPYLFPLVLPDLRNHYPGLTLILGEGRTADLLSSLLGGELDAILISMPAGETAVAEVPVFREPFFLACPPGHAACAPDGPGWRGLAPHERLLLEEGHCLRTQALAACSDVDVTNRHATSLETLKYMVGAGEGCTLLPALAAAETSSLVCAALPSEIYSRTIGLAWRGTDPRDDEFHALADSLRATFTVAGSAVQPV